MRWQVISQTTPSCTGHLIDQSQNHKLSDSTDKILALQGVGWLTRKIINSATITLYIKHYKDESGVQHIDIVQTISGGISVSPENRVLDWTLRKSEHSLFGATINRARRVALADVIDEYLNSGWLSEVSRDGAIEAYAEADKEKSSYSWISDMVSELGRFKSWTSHVLT